jgi:hypothetical protein
MIWMLVISNFNRQRRAAIQLRQADLPHGTSKQAKPNMLIHRIPCFAIILVCIGLGACSLTVPVAVVSKDLPGGILRGTATAALEGGSFNVSNGALSCGGSYDALDVSPTITIPVLCNDGRKGIVIATRDNSGISGGGHFTLNDGATGDFIFGPAAARL